MEQEKKYNLLTKRLLAVGYNAEHYPGHVKVCGSAWGKELWENGRHGFEYTLEYLETMTFRTGCGMLLKGSAFSSGYLTYAGIEWIPENDNPVITCPYRKDSCGLRNPILGGPKGGGISEMLFCDCHQTDEPYNYENSLDKAREDEKQRKKREYEEFSEKVQGHVCHWHMYYNDRKRKWVQHYNPLICAKNCQRAGGICDLTHKLVSGKRGNVFYDIKTSYVRHDGTLFDGEEIVSIEKGIRLFDTAKSMTICEAAAKRCKGEIRRRAEDRYHKEIYLYGWKVEILNIRAERRESRDLMQDLKDIRDGIQVTHASDLAKKVDEQKKQHRAEAAQKKIERLEKKILEVGYQNMEPYSLDRVHADKWLGEERINELEEIRKQKLIEEQEKPVQLSVFDMM